VILNWQDSLARVHVILRDRAGNASAQASMAARYAEPEGSIPQLLGGSDVLSHFIESQAFWHLKFRWFRTAAVSENEENSQVRYDRNFSLNLSTMQKSKNKTRCDLNHISE
jgi:hypothetical protein